MVELKPDNHLKGDYGEIIFEHFCKSNDYYFIKLEMIYNTLTPKNRLVFCSGWKRKEIVLPQEIIEEVRTFCKPSNGNEYEPSFTFDYLTIHSAYFEKGIKPEHFNWVEIKTDKSELRPNQKELIKKSRITCNVFRIHTEMQPSIKIEWELNIGNHNRQKIDL